MLRESPAGRQRAALRGDLLDVETELNFFDRQRIPSGAIFRALIGEAGLVGFCKLSSGSERLRIRHKSSSR
jgi:hypothetical protein